MRYLHGKAMSGGTAIDAAQARALEVEHLHALRDSYRARAPLNRTDDVLDQRIAEEMQLVIRQLELVEAELTRRAASGSAALADRLEKSEAALGDLAAIVAADDRCDGVARAAPDLKRRLNRRSIDGPPSPCENR